MIRRYYYAITPLPDYYATLLRATLLLRQMAAIRADIVTLRLHQRYAAALFSPMHELIVCITPPLMLIASYAITL